MWPFRPRPRPKTTPDGVQEALEALQKRISTMELDVAEAVDRMTRLHARIVKRAKVDENEGAVNGRSGDARMPSIAVLRAQGRLPWR